MTTIWKYTLEITDTQIVEMPQNAQMLTVQTQNDKPQLWAVVNPNNKLEPRQIDTYGTGNPVPENVGEYIGTYQIKNGLLVFHVFELK